jgi:hypothetical protein
LTSQSVSINTTDSDATYTTTIGSKAATFGGSVQVSSALVLDSTLLANGDPGVAGYVLTSANTSNVYWSSLSGYQTTSGLSANVATLTANNTSFVGSVSAANVVSNAQLSANLTSYQTTAGLSANVATLTANNANNLGGVAAASYVNTSGAYTISGIHTHTANVVVNGAIIAAGSSGSAGQVLTSNGSSNVYWSTITTAGGTVNYAQNAAPSLSVNSTSAVTLAQLTITTSGYPIHVMASGDANPLNAGGWGRIQLFRGTTAIGAQTHFEASAANENVPYCLQYIDTPGNGTYTYALKSTYVTGNTQFGETDGPVITAVELQTIQGGVNTAQQYTWSNTHIFNNQTRQAFSPLAGGANVYFIQQNDDNFVFYTSNTSNQPRAVWSIYANSVSSNLNFSAPVNFSGNVGLGSVSVAANGAYGSAGQVLTSNGSATYWSTVSSGGGGGNITFSATPPVSPTVGNDWIDTDTGIRYTYTYDGDSYQWVEFGTSSLSSGSSDPAIHPFMLAGM